MTHLSPGSPLDRYELLASLGDAGLARAALVRHPLTRARHLLQVLPARDGVDAQRLREAAFLLGRAGCPHLPSATDVLDLPDGVGVLSRYQEGPSLAELVSDGEPFDPGEVERVFHEICLAFTAAHDEGVHHGALAPSSVRLGLAAGEEGEDAALRVLVLGFGVRPAAERDAELGPGAYLAPEQLDDRAATNVRSDVFALGCLLYELLTGRAPFGRLDHPDTVRATLSNEHVPLGRLQPGASAAMVVAVERALAPEPGRRWGSVADLDREVTRGFSQGGIKRRSAAAAPPPRQEAEAAAPTPAPPVVETPAPRPPPAAAAGPTRVGGTTYVTSGSAIGNAAKTRVNTAARAGLQRPVLTTRDDPPGAQAPVGPAAPALLDDEDSLVGMRPPTLEEEPAANHAPAHEDEPEDRASSPQPLATMPPLPRRSRPSPWGAVLAAALLLLFVGGGVLWSWVAEGAREMSMAASTLRRDAPTLDTALSREQGALAQAWPELRDDVMVAPLARAFANAPTPAERIATGRPLVAALRWEVMERARKAKTPEEQAAAQALLEDVEGLEGGLDRYESVLEGARTEWTRPAVGAALFFGWLAPEDAPDTMRLDDHRVGDDAQAALDR